MTPDDSYEVPFDVDSQAIEEPELRDDDLDAARNAWEFGTADSREDSDEILSEEDAEIAAIAQPFVGRWNELISTTNWEKGRIIHQWRGALIESGAETHQYSDEAWARRVGGVTAPHVGRLRRVFDRFGSTYQTYPGLYWSHFLAALDWDDSPLWLEGASRENWSVARMREQRWEALGAVESNRPRPGEIIVVDRDEDVVLPAQGGGSQGARTKAYGDQPGVGSGPTFEGPDFGEDDELNSMASRTSPSPTAAKESSGKGTFQPFAGLPELPDDLSDAIEALKLAILRHKTSGWTETDPETIQRYLDAIASMMR